ncbi:glutamine amidotransferase-related protein [Asticcacaulis sp. 201]|uniref:glutamine amidotransferase-related protein n=1 Tax=Asticcacaulis sp. 201 TaxID=3028787 RepID=UPI002916E7CC|nr:gamma-glutamyl-gamma-aminobutyrate hydrolase family protein [Asticcacaulis sp. 201]MDV6329765.1 gamma-glutamyl-gamma-aminobutyrate hydrolase family protein [Asticcacaulis sp. 201]
MMRTDDYIAILETGIPPAGLDATYGSYADMFSTLLAGEGRAFRVFKTLAGELPPHDAQLKGVVITGSPAGVYEGDPWIIALMEWLRALDTQTPVVGICFGHQVMAQAWGGHVEKSPKGWGVGLHEYNVQAHDLWQTLAGKGAQTIACAVTHQDQVVKLPDNAIVLAGSEFTPHGAIYYTGRKGLSFQCHPEFCEDFASELLISRRGIRIDAALVDQAVETLKRPSHRHDLLGAISKFLTV